MLTLRFGDKNTEMKIKVKVTKAINTNPMGRI